MLPITRWMGNAQPGIMAMQNAHNEPCMNPDALTDQLSLFLDVLESGSFSAAARLHPLTPSAVSRRIDALERSLDCSLFSRSTHAVRATRPGWHSPNGPGGFSPNCTWRVPRRCR